MNNEPEKNEVSGETPNDSQAKPIHDELQDITKERDEYLNGWKRAKADLINYQKDESKRSEEILKYASLDTVKDLIPVLDSFDFALQALDKEGKAEKGMYMIRSQIEDILKRRGLERISVSPGDIFDTRIHEAVGEVSSSHPPGSIAEEVEKGYMLQGRVVRPVRVKLTKSL